MLGEKVEIGVRDGGGLGGGNSWCIGGPYWPGWFRKLWKVEEDTDEETGGTNSEDEEGGA